MKTDIHEAQKKLKEQDYKVSITVDATPQEAFENINNVSQWWTENLLGKTRRLNDEFIVRFKDIHITRQKIVELIPDQRVVWLVTESTLNFVKDPGEWKDTKIIFEIEEKGGKTQITFTHQGLVPELECYTNCNKGWNYYIKGSLYKLLMEGKGTPG